VVVKGRDVPAEACSRRRGHRCAARIAQARQPAVAGDTPGRFRGNVFVINVGRFQVLRRREYVDRLAVTAGAVASIAGHIFVAMPPLYCIDVGKKVDSALGEGKKQGALDRIAAESKRGKVGV
jgi:hypothetical protein